MATSEVQAEWEQKFRSAVEAREKARDTLKRTTASIASLKADASEASAAVTRVRANAKQAGVSLPKTGDVLESIRAAAQVNGAPVVPYAPGDESEDGEG